jgi:ABC-2 type transport system permease protein
MRSTATILKRELRSYFTTPVAYVFIVIFLLLSGILTFYMGGFFEREQADLAPFFFFHPWLYLILVPAISMRLWAEERKTGTIELLLTLPISTGQAVLGKFLAAWAFTAVALFATTPIWITVNLLGDPDNGVVLAAYIGSLLMAGGYLAIGSCISATTNNQVIAFVVSLVACLAFILAGLPAVLDFFTGWAPQAVIDTVSSFSFMTHFNSISKGVIDLRDLIFYGSLIGCFLLANTLILDAKKGE